MNADQKQKFLNELLGTHKNIYGRKRERNNSPKQPLDSHETVLFERQNNASKRNWEKSNLVFSFKFKREKKERNQREWEKKT